ncbi:AMP-binding protein [Castellaniella defragrans]|uniref:2-furoate---CoA ligase n=1 Tax=Castellaniella defragrans TaxID=75697 RepID=A0A7W9WPN5_CASDE|nr:AMP-binding protein [Castellaniella defragrans]KAB0609448.1 AMP-binding protein [Castellaniella defragrans]MBB6084020.1 2-furoate---CoA ligase [Castellaniella defragrans]
MLDLGRSFLACVERSPDEIALVDGNVRLSYAAWFEHVRNVAGGLHALGLRRGEHVVTVLQNRWETATLHWACQFLGLIVTPLNWRAKAEDVDYCIEDAQGRALVFQDVSAQAVAGSVAAAKVHRIVVGEALESGVGATFAFGDLLSSAPAACLLHAEADDWSLMLYTSGTTGRPKGVPRRHRHERAAALAHVAQNLYARGERTLGVMPLYHTMGVRSLLSMALIDGRFVCVPKFDSAAVLKAIENERISSLYLVPTLYHDVVSHPDFERVDVSSVRRLGFAGAPMNADLMQKLVALFLPELFVNHYGSSEVYTFSIDQHAAKKPGSAGKSGINQRIRVVRLNTGDPEALAAPYEEGEIIADLAGDEAFEGYWNRPDADARSLRDGWYFTGDIGYLDEEGDLFVAGRTDDMIISGGENISPVEIESLLSLHPAVDEVAVVGLPDPRWGQKVVAFIKRAGSVAEADLDEHCRTSGLANFKRPREYVFVREVPRSPVGKLLRRELAAHQYEQE